MSQRMSIKVLFMSILVYIIKRSSQMHSICSVLFWKTCSLVPQPYGPGAGRNNLLFMECGYMHYAAMLFFLFFFFFPIFSFSFTFPSALTSSYMSSPTECVQEAKPPTMKPRMEANATVSG